MHMENICVSQPSQAKLRLFMLIKVKTQIVYKFIKIRQNCLTEPPLNLSFDNKRSREKFAPLFSIQITFRKETLLWTSGMTDVTFQIEKKEV